MHLRKHLATLHTTLPTSRRTPEGLFCAQEADTRVGVDISAKERGAFEMSSELFDWERMTHVYADAVLQDCQA